MHFQAHFFCTLLGWKTTPQNSENCRFWSMDFSPQIISESSDLIGLLLNANGVKFLPLPPLTVWALIELIAQIAHLPLQGSLLLLGVGGGPQEPGLIHFCPRSFVNRTGSSFANHDANSSDLSSPMNSDYYYFGRTWRLSIAPPML